MPDTDLLDRLREADSHLRNTPVPHSVDMRMRERLAEGSRDKRRFSPWVPGLSFAAGALAVTVGVLVGQPRAPEVLPAPSAPVAAAPAAARTLAAPAAEPLMLAGFAVHTPRCDATPAGDGLQLAGSCTAQLEDARITVETTRSARLSRTDDGVALVDGRARFSVGKRAATDAPAVVHVGDSRIEILGTEFVVERTGESASVHLEEGRIRLVTPTGTRELLPGDAASFVTVTAKAPAPSATATRKPVAPAAAAPAPPQPVATPAASPAARALETMDPVDSAELSVVLRDVAALRGAGRYADAVAHLDTLLSRPLPSRTAEVLSFERTTLLERAGRTSAEICDAARAHSARFADGTTAARTERIAARACR
jgi:hypothetical protein